MPNIWLQMQPLFHLQKKKENSNIAWQDIWAKRVILSGQSAIFAMRLQIHSVAWFPVIIIGCCKIKLVNNDSAAAYFIYSFIFLLICNLIFFCNAASCTYEVVPSVQSVSFQMFRSEEAEWRAEVDFSTIVFCNDAEYMITA